MGPPRLLLPVLLCCLSCHVVLAVRDARYIRGYQLNTSTSVAVKRVSDVYMETPDILRKHGYPVESHVIITKDGYILTVHRIPHGRAGRERTRVRRPILLMHCLLAASDLWVISGPDKGLGFILADEGYDVWMGNARGNYYSRKHVTLKPKDSKFWDFTWHEMGNVDLPAVIDYILDTTHTQQIFYVGHSMGTTMFFALMATQPEYNAKVAHMVGLAPVARNGRIRMVFGELYLPFFTNIIDGFYRAGQMEIFPRRQATNQLVDSVCRDKLIGQATCILLYFSVFGVDAKQLNTTMLPTFMSHLFSGTSTHTLNHYVENHKAGKFQWYDKTRKRLPMLEYNLTKITVPISLHYGLNDALLHPKAVMRLSKQLPNVVGIFRLKEERANHMDLVLAIDSKKLVFNDVLRILNKYNN